jgi:hypothetical protein
MWQHLTKQFTTRKKVSTQMTSNDILIIFYSEQKTEKLNVSVIMNTLGTLLKYQNEKREKCPGGKIDKLWKVFCVRSSLL